MLWNVGFSTSGCTAEDKCSSNMGKALRKVPRTGHIWPSQPHGGKCKLLC